MATRSPNFSPVRVLVTTLLLLTQGLGSQAAPRPRPVQVVEGYSSISKSVTASKRLEFNREVQKHSNEINLSNDFNTKNSDRIGEADSTVLKNTDSILEQAVQHSTDSDFSLDELSQSEKNLELAANGSTAMRKIADDTMKLQNDESPQISGIMFETIADRVIDSKEDLVGDGTRSESPFIDFLTREQLFNNEMTKLEDSDRGGDMHVRPKEVFDSETILPTEIISNDTESFTAGVHVAETTTSSAIVTDPISLKIETKTERSTQSNTLAAGDITESSTVGYRIENASTDLPGIQSPINLMDSNDSDAALTTTPQVDYFFLENDASVEPVNSATNASWTLRQDSSKKLNFDYIHVLNNGEDSTDNLHDADYEYDTLDEVQYFDIVSDEPGPQSKMNDASLTNASSQPFDISSLLSEVNFSSIDFGKLDLSQIDFSAVDLSSLNLSSLPLDILSGFDVSKLPSNINISSLDLSTLPKNIDINGIISSLDKSLNIKDGFSAGNNEKSPAKTRESFDNVETTFNKSDDNILFPTVSPSFLPNFTTIAYPRPDFFYQTSRVPEQYFNPSEIFFGQPLNLRPPSHIIPSNYPQYFFVDSLSNRPMIDPTFAHSQPNRVLFDSRPFTQTRNDVLLQPQFEDSKSHSIKQYEEKWEEPRSLDVPSNRDIQHVNLADIAKHLSTKTKDSSSNDINKLLSNVDFSKIDFSNFNLGELNLEEIIKNVDLSSLDLSQVKLNNTDLSKIMSQLLPSSQGHPQPSKTSVSETDLVDIKSDGPTKIDIEQTNNLLRPESLPGTKLWVTEDEADKHIVDELGISHLVKMTRSMSLGFEGGNMDFLLCTICKTGVVTGQKLMNDLQKTDREIKSLVIYICIQFGMFPEEVCRGVINIVGDEVLYVLRNTKYPPETFCGLMLNNQCEDAPLNSWSLSVNAAPGPKPLVVTPPATGSLKILHISDLHLDAEYEEGTLAICKLPLCCRDWNRRLQRDVTANNKNTSNMDALALKIMAEADDPNMDANLGMSPSDKFPSEAGKWGAFGRCDLPLRTIDNILEAGAELNPDIVYVTGDLPPHDVWQQTRDSVTESNRITAESIRKAFPNTPVVMTVGNHEIVPFNSFPVPEVYHLGYNPAWLYESLAEHWKTWIPESSIQTLKRGGYYSVSPKKGLRVLSVNGNYCNSMNWWLLLSSQDPLSQLSWLEEQLIMARKEGEKVHILSHIPPGNPDCEQNWSKQFAYIVSRHADLIMGIFSGHQHLDQWQVIYDPDDYSRTVGVTYIAPSATTFREHSPSFRVFTVDGGSSDSTWAVVDHTTYTTNLTEANKPGNVPVYKVRYSAKEAFAMQDLSPASWENVVHTMATNQTMFNDHMRFKHNYWSEPSEIKNCDLACKTRSLCFLLTGDSSNKLPCENLKPNIAL